jgi:hypothetical protein
MLRPSCNARIRFTAVHIILEGRLGLLDDADIEAVLDKKLADAFPARTVCPDTVDEDDILHLVILSL